MRDHFFGDKLFGGLADQALIVGQIGGSEDIFGRARCDQKRAAATSSDCETGVVAIEFSFRPPDCHDDVPNLAACRPHVRVR